MGGGIVGLALARELVARGRENVVVIEKEPELGCHASGRNSGVLHAGIYYAPDSLKARSCLRGNFLMREFCKARGLPVLEKGKVIVARSEEELPALDELHRRALANGAEVEFLDEQQLEDVEPAARTVGRALFSRHTAAVDPQLVLQAIRLDLEASGRATLVLGCGLVGRAGRGRVQTTLGEISYSRLVNAAGAHCDRVARLFGLGQDYRLVPFKGTYRKLRPGASFPLNGNIYPVPDPRNPFLGVHFSRSVRGEVYLGPTAIPALGRENYGLLAGADRGALGILAADLVLFLRNPGFREVALVEPRKYLATFFHREARRLVRSFEPGDFERAAKVGIRPQLVNWRTKELVTDFLVEAQDETVHLLNPISPAFTSSMDLARVVADRHFG
ncbi:MAG TPA: L-2-hydroxyglutarate oxidase [Anaeromyxobacter sp.]|nr:L-2-hydroxyglutarate oxidase [Anaeromyxobacter sp.]